MPHAAQTLAPTYLALAPTDYTPTRFPKVLSNAPYALPKRNPNLQKFAQYIPRAKLGHDERHGTSRRRERSSPNHTLPSLLDIYVHPKFRCKSRWIKIDAG